MSPPSTQFPSPAPLSQPLNFVFSGKVAKNRFMKAAMSERLSTWDPADIQSRGIPTRELINVYRRWAEGGFGVIVTGNVMIEYDHLEAAGNSIITPSDNFQGARFEAFQSLAAIAKAHGSLILAQLNHSGRQVPASINKTPISASGIKLETNDMGLTFERPRAVGPDDIERVIKGFAHAAEYLYRAGFDGIQLHAAHGYLLAQFLSTTTNVRVDRYGGSLLNRSRIVFEITDRIRARVPDKRFILSIKLNSVELQEGGFTTDECKQLCGQLQGRGYDFVELSGGTYQKLGFRHTGDSTVKREAFFMHYADMIIPELRSTKVYVTGGFRTTQGMLDALRTVNGVGLARPVTHEFDLPLKISEKLVSGAAESPLDEGRIQLSNLAAGIQIRLVGQDKKPLDLSREDHWMAFCYSLQRWRQLTSNDELNLVKSRFAEVVGVKLEPFGAIDAKPSL